MTYIKIDPKGTRLGNWMFQFAAAKTAAPKEPVTFVVADESDRVAVQKYAELWGDVQYVLEAPTAANVRVGLFQDVQYVDRPLVRSLFLHALARQFDRGNGDGDVAAVTPRVSIHVRRGDYMRLPHRHPFVGKKYLLDAVARFPDSEFMVFSDDMNWCKRFFKGPCFHFAEGNSVLADLYLMTQCKGGHICSNSTFSWWGAYLGEGKTIFPSMWYGPAISDADWRGLYFEGSEIIENHYTFGLWLKAKFYQLKTRLGNVLRRVVLR